MAKLSLIPNVYINEFFLDPTLNFSQNRPSLFNIMHKLVENLQISVKGIENLHYKLKITKSLLLGETIPAEQLLYIDNAEEKILQSLIVLEEFCKEISSIIYVKNYILKLCDEKRTKLLLHNE